MFFFFPNPWKTDQRCVRTRVGLNWVQFIGLMGWMHAATHASMDWNAVSSSKFKSLKTPKTVYYVVWILLIKQIELCVQLQSINQITLFPYLSVCLSLVQSREKLRDVMATRAIHRAFTKRTVPFLTSQSLFLSSISRSVSSLSLSLASSMYLCNWKFIYEWYLNCSCRI